MKEDLKSMLWSVLDQFKNIGMHNHSYWSVLFIFVIQRRENVFGGISHFNAYKHKDLLIESLNKLSDDLSIPHSAGIDELLLFINRFTPGHFRDLSEKIYHIDNEVSDDFTDFFEEVLSILSKYDSSEKSFSLQPKEITSFVATLINKEDYQSVYNPYAGVASYEIALNKSHFYLGQELDSRVWAIGKLRLFVHNKISENVEFRNETSFLSEINADNKYDLIISSPPFGRVPGHRSETFEYSLIEKGLEQLSSTGRMLVITTLGFLVSPGKHQSLRQKLVENDLIESVITFPGGIFTNSGVLTALLVINKTKVSQNTVKLFDGTSFFKNASSREKILDTTALLDSFDKKEEPYYSEIYNTAIADQNYILDPIRYSVPTEKIDGILLGSIVEFTTGSRSYQETNGKVIKTRDLHESFQFSPLQIDKVEDLDVTSQVIRKISESCILVSLRHRTLRPTYFEFSGAPIFISHDIAALIPNDKIVLNQFLLNALSSEQVEQQLIPFRTGYIFPIIKRADLLSIKIPIPSLEEQERQIVTLDQVEARLQRLTAENNILVHDKNKSNFDDLASIKHTSGRARQNILDWSTNILSFMEDNSKKFESLNSKFKEFYTVDMFKALHEIKEEINFVTDILERGEKGLVLSDYPLTSVSVKKIHELLNNISRNGMNFEIIKKFDDNLDMDDLSITSNLTLLKIMIDNILTNANKHGFENYRSTNEVVISMFVENTYLILEIKNNGKPFPKNFNKEKFASKFSTSDKSTGTGLGGYDIDRIAHYFSSEHINSLKQWQNILGKEGDDIGLEAWDLLLNIDPVYPVIFKFSFNIWVTAMNL